MPELLDILNNEKSTTSVVDNSIIVEEKLISVDDLLPTKRQHISYSELHDWIECNWRHKLKYVDNINLDSESIHTTFGTLIHDMIDTKLTIGDLENPIDWENIKNNWTNNIAPAFIERNKTNTKVLEEFEQNYIAFGESIEPISKSIIPWLNNTFPGWSLVKSEYKIYESILNHKDRFFKGFVDCIIKIPNPKKKDSFLYWILDWKCTSWGWSFDKKTNFNKQMQLILYKHFFARINNIPLKDIRCGFVLLKRTPTKNSDSNIELVPVSVGPISEEKALRNISSMLVHLKKKLYLKNRYSCKYCKYSNTEHCT